MGCDFRAAIQELSWLRSLKQKITGSRNLHSDKLILFGMHMKTEIKMKASPQERIL